MVTMSSEKTATCRKPAENNEKLRNNGQSDESIANLNNIVPIFNRTPCTQDTPNYLVYKKVRSQIKFSH